MYSIILIYSSKAGEQVVRIERLNNDKIKVTLTMADLISFDVDIAELSPDSKELHNFLFRIMETIRVETGFNPYNGQVVVEATPSNDGMSIVVSRVKPSQGRIMRDEIRRGITVKAKQKKSADTEIYYFEVFDDLCGALTELSETALIKSSLYRLNGTFCFILRGIDGEAKSRAVLSEFSSKKSKYPMQLTYITEHGSLIAEYEKLAAMAENIKRLV